MTKSWVNIRSRPGGTKGANFALVSPLGPHRFQFLTIIEAQPSSFKNEIQLSLQIFGPSAGPTIVISCEHATMTGCKVTFFLLKNILWRVVEKLTTRLFILTHISLVVFFNVQNVLCRIKNVCEKGKDEEGKEKYCRKQREESAAAYPSNCQCKVPGTRTI